VLTLESDQISPPENEAWTKVRRWDHVKRANPEFDDNTGTVKVDDNTGTVKVTESSGDSGWIDLEQGIQIQFLSSPDPKKPNHYRTGDYWLIPARVATGDIEWPLELDANDNPIRLEDGRTKPLPLPPSGIHHHYAPLAILTANSSGWSPADSRWQFRPIKLGVKFKLDSFGEEGIGGHLLCNSPSDKAK
jgi:hypothetical protein